jgi:thiamine pyrophosphate-dependent acetolactate synthase large subunit-like protein
LAGATATILKNRGSLQDIDQQALLGPHVKWMGSAKRVADIPGLIAEAFYRASSGVPGPVFLELPVDLLYDYETVHSWYLESAGKSNNVAAKIRRAYLNWYVNRRFSKAAPAPFVKDPVIPSHAPGDAARAAEALAASKRPVLVIGSQCMLQPDRARELARAVRSLGIPVFLAGMARGLLGPEESLQFRHKRSQALKEADLILIAGLPIDFRLNYGFQLNRRAFHIAVNRSRSDLRKNKRPSLAVLADPCDFLIDLARKAAGTDRSDWLSTLQKREDERDAEIQAMAKERGRAVNPVELAKRFDDALGDHSILVVDGGDFVATSAYVVRPRGPLSWLDPGLFGTLGVGAGFALGAKLASPKSDVWILYGDGSCGFSLMEYDTFARHNIGVMALVGNDACWSQIERDQTAILKDSTACMLRHTDYHRVVDALGAKGFLVKKSAGLARAFAAARSLSRKGVPSLINTHIDRSEFRKGSISM